MIDWFIDPGETLKVFKTFKCLLKSNGCGRLWQKTGDHRAVAPKSWWPPGRRSSAEWLWLNSAPGKRCKRPSLLTCVHKIYKKYIKYNKRVLLSFCWTAAAHNRNCRCFCLLDSTVPLVAFGAVPVHCLAPALKSLSRMRWMSRIPPSLHSGYSQQKYNFHNIISIMTHNDGSMIHSVFSDVFTWFIHVMPWQSSTVITLWLHVLVVFHGFSHGSWITFWPFGSPTEPINPHTCKRKLLGDLKRLRLSPEKKTKTNIILICQLIHHDPCFTMIFQGVSGCFASIGLVNRCNAVPELGAWILCHPTSTTWQTGQICVCVCVAKKRFTMQKCPKI